MKRTIYRLILLAGWLLVLPAGCQFPAPGETGALSGGQMIQTALSVTLPADVPQTKSRYSGPADAVNNWNLLVFENDTLRAKYYQGSGSDLNLPVLTDRPYRYYALANVGDLRERFTVGVTTVADMASLRLDAGLSDGLPMAWHSTDALAFSRRALAAGQKLSVPLTRLVGRYDIVVDQTGLSAWSFTATRLQLCGASDVAPFAGSSRATAATTVTDAATSADLAALNAGTATSYYPLENCLGTLLPAESGTWDKIPANIPAGNYPSYIEIGGTLRMTDGSQLERDVTYRFCLGENATDNFDVIRNRTHTVTLLLNDASVAGGSSHWKLETGAFTDIRSLAFADADILLLTGSSVEEAIVRTPAGVKFIAEADAALIQAGVSLAEGAWGDVFDCNQLTLTAPSDAGAAVGTLRVRTLDGAKSATATLTVGRIPTSLAVSPATAQRILTGGQTVSYTFKVTYQGMSGSYDVDPDDVVWTVGDPDMVEYAGGGVLRSKSKRGSCTLGFSYTENGTTVAASCTVTTYAILQSLRIEPNDLYLPDQGETAEVSTYGIDYAASSSLQFHAYARYHDDIEADVTNSCSWGDFMYRVRYKLSSDDPERVHMASTWAYETCNGEIYLYRAYTYATSYADLLSQQLHLGSEFGDDTEICTPSDCTFIDAGRDYTFCSATYTEGGVTLKAYVTYNVGKP